jgi:hypothetical protein
MGASLDRRDHRYQVRLSATLIARHGETALVTGDVSYRGVFLRTDDPPARRRLVRVRLELPPEPGEVTAGMPLAVDGMVANVIPPGDPGGRAPGAGIEFYGLNGQVRARWERFIRQLQSHPETMDQPMLATKPGFSDPVRRRHPRHPVVLHVVLEAAGADRLRGEPEGGGAFVRDISKGGMFIRTDEPLPVGAGLVVRFVSPLSDATFRVECVVRRRVFGTEAGLGVEYLGMTPEAWSRLVEFLQPVARLGGPAWDAGEATHVQLMRRSSVPVAP